MTHAQTYRHEYLVHVAGSFRWRFHEQQAIVFCVRLSFLQPSAAQFSVFTATVDNTQ